MNKRIKELAEQAGMIIVDDEFSTYGKFAEKFSELVATHCANICLEMAAKCAGLPGDGALAKDCAYWILEDFGVNK